MVRASAGTVGRAGALVRNVGIGSIESRRITKKSSDLVKWNHDESRKTIAKVTESVDRVRSDRGQAGSVRQPRHVPP